MSIIMQNKYGELFKRYYNKIESMFLIEANMIVSELFPSILTETGQKFDRNDVCPLTDYITSTWEQPLRKNIILAGDGGAGKTTNLLRSYKDFISQGIKCAFIPLSYLEGVKAATIEDYFKEYIIRKQDVFLDFLESIETEGQQFGKPYFILFLDGYNEVYRSKNQLYIDLRRWLSYSGIQIVISTRESICDISFLKNHTTELATLQPLDYKHMIVYVNKSYCNVDLPHLPKFILGNPMLLTLFVSTQTYIDKHKNDSFIHLRQDYTPGGIIWNYMQLQILKHNELLRGRKEFGKEQCNLITAINCILPYIGWAMEKNQRLTITYDDLTKLVRDAYSGNWGICKQLLTECCYENGIYTWDFNEDSIQRIILEKLAFFKKNDGMIHFRHQYYRDFFAAFYFYTNLFTKDIDTNKFLNVWGTELVSFDTLRLFCDLLDESQIQQLAKHCSNVIPRKFNYAVDNLLQVYGIIYEGDLSQTTLDHLDLRGVYLNQYRLVQYDTAAKFSRCDFSSSSFFGDGHHGRVITAAYSPDDKYIASSCTNGEIKTWQAGSGKKLLELIEDSSVYSLCWISQSEFVYGTMKGACYLYNIDQRKKSKLFEVKSTGIKSICFHGEKLYVGCTNGVLLHGTIHQVDPRASIQDSIVKIICIEQTVLFLDSASHVWFLSPKDNSLHLINSTKDRVTDICYNKDSIVACTLDGRILCWPKRELTAHNICSPISKNIGHSFRFSSVEASENKFFIGTQNGEIIIFDIDKNDKLILPIEHIGWVRTVSYSTKEKEIVSAGSDGKIILWDINSLSPKTEKSGIPNMVLCHKYLQNSNLIISSSNDCKVVIWDLDSHLKAKELIGHVDWVRCIATGNKHDIIASGGSDGRIYIWTIHNRQVFNITNTLLYQGDSWIMSLDWNSDDCSLVSSMRNGEIHLWTKTAEQYVDKLLYSHSSAALCACFSPSGKYIASSDQSGYIIIHNCANTIIIQKTSDHPVRQIRWSEDEQYLYACCLDGNIIKYRFEKDSLVEIARIDSYGARSIELMDKKILFAGDSRELWLADFLHKSERVDKLHHDSIDYIAQNKSYISTSGHDGNIVVREKNRLEKVITLRLIPDLNISGCEFMNCSFENEELRCVLTMNGGIIIDNLLP